MENKPTTNADHKPETIENLGDGTFHYNFDVVRDEKEKENENSESWSYNQVRLPYPIDVQAIQDEININGFKHKVNESEVILTTEY